LLERLPNEEDKNKTFEFAGLEFKIIDVKQNTVNKVQIKVLKQENIEEED
jgi:CBS domain containing-hemolysin-like protein